MEPIKAGIIGFGRVAENSHLQRMTESDLYELVGVCDITESRRQLAETEYGLRVTGDLDEFLQWEIELVLITTHSSAHHADALRVAAAGKHMFIEKPIAVTAADAEEMVAAARENGVVLSVNHNRHFDKDACLVRAAVQDGLLGDIISIENRTMGAAPAVGFGVKDFNQEWRITASQGGGTLLDFGPHWVEQCLSLMGDHKVVSVFGDVRHIRWGDADDLFDITMVFDNGARARASKADVSWTGLGYKWIVLGTEASLKCSGGRADEVVISGPDYETRRRKREPGRSLHENLARHLRGEEDLIITADHALRVMKVLDAGRRSGECGKSIDVEV